MSPMTSEPVRIVDSIPLRVQLEAGTDINIGDVEILAGTEHIGQTSLDQPIPAGEAHIGSVGGKCFKISGSVQRPNDTTTYAARDVIGTAVTANITLADVARIAGGSGFIFKTRIISSANKALKPTFELWIFDTAPANVADNAPFAPSDAELLTVQAVIPVTTGYVGNAGADANGNYILISDAVPFSFKCTSLVKNLYAVLVVTNAYIPIAQEIFTVVLDVMQD